MKFLLQALFLTGCEIPSVGFVTEPISFHPVTVIRNRIFMADSRNYAPAYYFYHGKTYRRHVCFPYWRDPSRFDFEGQARSDAYFRAHGHITDAQGRLIPESL